MSAMATSALGPDGTVAIDGLVLSAPGVRGEVSVERVARPGRVPAGGAAAGTAPDPLDRALRRQRMRTYRTVAVQGSRPALAAAAARAARSSRGSWTATGAVDPHRARPAGRSRPGRARDRERRRDVASERGITLGGSRRDRVGDADLRHPAGPAVARAAGRSRAVDRLARHQGHHLPGGQAGRDGRPPPRPRLGRGPASVAGPRLRTGRDPDRPGAGGLGSAGRRPGSAVRSRHLQLDRGRVRPAAVRDDGGAPWALRRACHRLRPSDPGRRPVRQCPGIL